MMKDEKAAEMDRRKEERELVDLVFSFSLTHFRWCFDGHAGPVLVVDLQRIAESKEQKKNAAVAGDG